MIYASIALFGLAALGGLAILINWLSKKDAPRPVVYAHGLAAIAAFAILIVYSVQNPDNYPKVSLIIFSIVAAAGLYMFIRDMQKGVRSVGIALIHALAAVTGVIMLLLFAFA